MDDYTEDEIKRFAARLAAEQRGTDVSALTHGPAPVTPEAPRGPTMMINDPTRGMRPANAFERFMMGAGAGAQNVLTNIGEMTGVVPTDVATQRLEANRPFTQSTAGKVGEFVGETGALAPVTGAAGRLVSGGGRFFGYGGPVVRGATEGGLAGAVTAGPGERKTGAAFGAGTALAVPGVGGAYRSLTRGIEATDAARNLGQRGVTLTPGQINPESNWALLEESMLALPVIGTRVTKARQQAWRETQGAIAQEAAPPGVKITPKDDVRQTMVDLENAYTQAYDVAKGFPKLQLSVVRTQGGNEPLRTALVVPQTKAVKASSRNYVNKFLNEEMERLVAQAKKNNGYVSSDELLGFRSRIREKVRNLRSSPDANLFEADDLLEGAEQKVTQALESQLPPDVSASLRAIDAQYVKKKVLENAVYRASSRPEGFTPEQFALEVRAATESKGKFARGGGPMRDISMEASEVFPPRQPMTGRQLPGQIAGIAAGTLSYPFYGESQASKLARQLLLGGTKPQQAIQEFERKFKRKLSPAEREAMATVLRTSAGVYGEEERPLPFATTAPF